MKITSKKVYCRKCKKLASVRREVDGDITTVLCNVCNSASYSWDRVSWKYVGG